MSKKPEFDCLWLAGEVGLLNLMIESKIPGYRVTKVLLSMQAEEQIINDPVYLNVGHVDQFNKRTVFGIPVSADSSVKDYAFVVERIKN